MPRLYLAHPHAPGVWRLKEVFALFSAHMQVPWRLVVMTSPLWYVGCSLFTTLFVVFIRSKFDLNAASTPARLRNVIKEASKTAVGISIHCLDYYPGRIILSGLFGRGHDFP
jgi:hypothetical protein